MALDATSGGRRLASTSSTGPHRRSHTVHIDAGRIGRDLQAQLSVLVRGKKIKLAPPWDDGGAQPERPAETLGRPHGLVGRLTIGEQHPRKGEDKIGTLLQRPASFPNQAWQLQALLCRPEILRRR
jgi:hypothetical protein